MSRCIYCDSKYVSIPLPCLFLLLFLFSSPAPLESQFFSAPFLDFKSIFHSSCYDGKSLSAETGFSASSMAEEERKKEIKKERKKDCLNDLFRCMATCLDELDHYG